MLFVSTLLFAEVNVTKVTQESNETLLKQQMSIEQERKKLIQRYLEQLREIKERLNSDSIWIKSYASHMTYLDVAKKLEQVRNRIKKLSRHGDTTQEMGELESLMAKEKILSDQLGLLKQSGKSPFSELLKPEEISEIPKITNPFEIITAYTYKKRLDEQFLDYKKRQKELESVLTLLRKEQNILENLASIDDDKHIGVRLLAMDNKLEDFERALDTVSITSDVYLKRIEEIDLQLVKEIKKQTYKLFQIGVILLFLFLFFFGLKIIIKKYITDNERFYMANKIITFINITITIIVILFAYIENVNYLITVLGFASAGIAIAMKDWFMSMLGWLVIVFGGSIHVGDRVKFMKDGMEYVGDVLDISLLRITVFEDVTLTSFMVNRRAGRVVFVPNNYIFTSMISNYTHASLKTVWDGIDITISFDSNHKKAVHITKEVCRKYSKGYTDITRKQLNKLRSRYSLKNTNVEPRVFTFIEENGINVSSWYLTNAYATLTLRSVISADIVDAFNAEEDITIAYPTQKLHIERHRDAIHKELNEQKLDA